MSDFVITSITNSAAPFNGVWETEMLGWADPAMPEGFIGSVTPEPSNSVRTVCYLPTLNKIMLVSLADTPQTWFTSMTLLKTGGVPNTYNQVDATFDLLQDNGQPGGSWATWFWSVPNNDFFDNNIDNSITTAVTFVVPGSGVPDVTGDDLPTAVSTIIGAGFTVGVITIEDSDTVPVDEIAAQNPIGGTAAPPGTAIDLVVSTGPASFISKLTQKLLLYLHRIFDKDPHQNLALRIQYDGDDLVWSISNGILTLTATGGSGTSYTFNIANFSVGQLADFIGSLPGYSVPFQDASSYSLLSALVLLDSSGDINTSNGDHVYGYTNFIWAYLEANGSELATAKDQIPNALAQMNTMTATDEWLDFQGGYYDVPRNQNELDPSYSPRIIASVLQPRGNNVAIASAIQAIALGAQSVRVIDAIDNTSLSITYNGLITFNGAEFYDGGLGPNGAYGFFDVDFSYDFSGTVTQATYLAQIESTVQAFRDGGTQLRAVIFRNNGSTTLIVSDSFIGGVRVIVYDDFSGNNYRLLESGLVRLLENDVDARLLE